MSSLVHFVVQKYTLFTDHVKNTNTTIQDFTQKKSDWIGPSYPLRTHIINSHNYLYNTAFGDIMRNLHT